MYGFGILNMKETRQVPYQDNDVIHIAHKHATIKFYLRHTKWLNYRALIFTSGKLSLQPQCINTLSNTWQR